MTSPTYDPEQAWLHLIGGGNGIIYGIRADGAVVWYRHLDPAGGSFSWANGGYGRVIGSGFNNFTWVGGSADGQVFGLHGDGELWRYRYVLTNASTGEGYWENGGTGTVVATGWGIYPRVFGGPDGVMWTVDVDGFLYRAPYVNGACVPVRVGSGHKGVHELFADSGDVIYGVIWGVLYWWRFAEGDWVDACRPVQIGDGGWGDHLAMFAGIGGTIYVIPPDATHQPPADSTLIWLRLTNPLTVRADGGARWANNANGRVVGLGFTVGGEAQLQGYPDRTSFPVGGTAKFAVSTTFSTFTAALVRADTVAGDLPTVWGPVTVTGGLQRLPSDYRAGGCGWTNNVNVPLAGLAPGVYALKLGGARGMTRYITIVVRPAAPAADVAVLIPVNTYQAYNTWGGHSQYTLGPAAPRPLTLHRPCTRTEPVPVGRNRAELYSDLLLLRWMASKGIAYDVYTDVDLDTSALLLTGYKAVVLGSHAEYWTDGMRQSLLNYLGSGGHVVNTGGNGIYERMRYNADRSQIVFRTAGGNRDLFDTTGQPTSQVLGVNYDSVIWNTYAPYQVTQAGHPLLAGTGLANGALFGANGYNGAGSGLETDGLLGGAGEATAAQIFARGTNPGSRGGAVMAQVSRTGGWVFTASSITFNGTLYTDPVTSRILSNVFNAALAAPRPSLSVGPDVRPAPATPVQPPEPKEGSSD